MTNGDRIRQMTDEEMADAMRTSKEHMCRACTFRNKYCTSDDCRKGYLEWIKKEVTDDRQQ